jgi:hypothetical protein
MTLRVTEYFEGSEKNTSCETSTPHTSCSEGRTDFIPAQVVHSNSTDTHGFPILSSYYNRTFWLFIYAAVNWYTHTHTHTHTRTHTMLEVFLPKDLRVLVTGL